jgi:hypothetical protein
MFGAPVGHVLVIAGRRLLGERRDGLRIRIGGST